ncbi:ComF family protein [Cytobacillus oceanisediminis]|uniref:ComF family protein n=1 Tax=Cytobacillus oceanisediminis TaxID=665099 RepID=UPI00249595C8|nr:ComF family protein [Cytobacillus oceanisediminis]
MLDKNHSIFSYDDFLKETIARYKFRGDYILAKAFSPYIKKWLQPCQFDFIIPIPLSPERLYDRGFNQSEALIREAGFPSADLIKRTHSEKQSKKSRYERIHIQQVFELRSNINVEKKRILLADDIYTTGSTLYHAARMLKQAGASSVISFTLAR